MSGRGVLLYEWEGGCYCMSGRVVVLYEWEGGGTV